MKNIEIKTPLDDRSRVERALESMDARIEWVREQRDTFFHTPTVGWLKLREEKATDIERAELISYRRPTDETGPRTSDYDLAPIDDPAAWKRLLERVLPIRGVVAKERTLWLWRHTRIHLDRVEGLGDFLELETVVAGISPGEALAESREAIERLALDADRFVAVPYLELLEGA